MRKIKLLYEAFAYALHAGIDRFIYVRHLQRGGNPDIF
jgi:hypothetical protein